MTTRDEWKDSIQYILRFIGGNDRFLAHELKSFFYEHKHLDSKSFFTLLQPIFARIELYEWSDPGFIRNLEIANATIQKALEKESPIMKN